MGCKTPSQSLPPSSPVGGGPLGADCLHPLYVNECGAVPPAPITVQGRDCAGALTNEDVNSVVQTIPHPDYVQRVELCTATTPLDTITTQVLCDPATGDRIIVVITTDGTTGIPTTAAYTMTGAPWGGVITTLTACPSEQYDITEGGPWCDTLIPGGRTTIHPVYVFDVTVNPPVLLTTIWMDANGNVVTPTGNQIEGACNLANPVFEGRVFNLLIGGALNYGGFPSTGVRTMTVTNLTNDFIDVAPVFSPNTGLVNGTGVGAVPPHMTATFDFDSVLMTDVNIQDTGLTGQGGGFVHVMLQEG